MQQPKSDEEKLLLINLCRNSGLSDNTWCQKHGIPTTTLHGWVRKFEHNGHTFPEPAGKKAASNKIEVVKLDLLPDSDRTNSTLLRGRMDLTPNTPNTSAPLELPAIEMTFGKLSIKFSNDVNPILFEKAISALGGVS